MYDLMKLFMNALIQKAGKDSYDVPSAWRNILMGSPSQKALTMMDCNRHFKFLELTKSTGHTVLSGRKGFPAIVYAVKKLTLGIQMVAAKKPCMVITSWDVKQCYPTAEKVMCIIILQW